MNRSTPPRRTKFHGITAVFDLARAHDVLNGFLTPVSSNTALGRANYVKYANVSSVLLMRQAQINPALPMFVSCSHHWICL